jgi:hypothetical protein
LNYFLRLASRALTIARACSGVRVRRDFAPPFLPSLEKYLLNSLFFTCLPFDRFDGTRRRCFQARRLLIRSPRIGIKLGVRKNFFDFIFCSRYPNYIAELIIELARWQSALCVVVPKLCGQFIELFKHFTRTSHVSNIHRTLRDWRAFRLAADLLRTIGRGCICGGIVACRCGATASLPCRITRRYCLDSRYNLAWFVSSSWIDRNINRLRCQ